MPATELDLLIEAAREAGDIARKFWRKSPETWHKPAGAGPVTEADLAVNAMLYAKLGRARPDYGWLSEETPDDPARLSTERVFIVDPIDGTRAFIDGDTGFAHALAVCEHGRVTAAVVYLPLRDQLYAASLSGGATLNGAPIRASARSAAAGATLLTSKPNLAPDLWNSGGPPPFRRAFRGAMAWRLCLVAEAAFDANITLRPAWEWDIAAGDLIAREAGAEVTDRRGRPITYNSPSALADGLIAAPAPLWTILRDGLRD
ncbi:MAG: 3'(2'),5'-bisphosphate nucleotidase CysQ [Paracoccaceae bacterium]